MPSQSKIKDFCQLSHRESQGRCRARGRHWRGGRQNGGGRVAERSESKNNMIAGGNHTIIHNDRPYIYNGKCCEFAGKQ